MLMIRFRPHSTRHLPSQRPPQLTIRQEFTGVRAIVEATEVNGSADITAVTLDSTNLLQINGATITGFRVQDNDADDSLINAINAVTDETGVVASLDEDNRLQLTADDGRNVEITVSGNATRLGLQRRPEQRSPVVA